MLKYVEAIADVIYKDFCWFFGKFFCGGIAKVNWTILKLPWLFIANMLSTWLSKVADKTKNITYYEKLYWEKSLSVSVYVQESFPQKIIKTNTWVLTY